MSAPRWPALVVFDLDFTLWDCGGTWCDCLRPPFARTGSGVHDANRSAIRVYPDVPRILEQLSQSGCRLAIASRTEQPGWARELLDLLGLTSAFPHQAIYPGDKQRHFLQLREESGVSFADMLFFDDEMRNIRSVGALGVHAWAVHSGMDAGCFAAGLQAWREGSA